MVPKSSKIIEKEGLGHLGRPWNANRLKILKSKSPGFFLEALGRHLVDFGCVLGAHWILKGSRNRKFFYEININDENLVTRSGA